MKNKTFEEYKDGDWVVLNNPGHEWHGMQFQAYKSQWTPDAFRLKYGDRELISDLSEIRPLSESTQMMKESNEKSNSDLRTDPGPTGVRSQYDDFFDFYGQD